MQITILCRSSKCSLKAVMHIFRSLFSPFFPLFLVQFSRLLLTKEYPPGPPLFSHFPSLATPWVVDSLQLAASFHHHLPCVGCHLFFCLWYSTKIAPLTMSRGSKESLHKAMPQCQATFYSTLSVPVDPVGHFLFLWFSWKFSLHLSSEPVWLSLPLSSKCSIPLAFWLFCFLFYVLSIGKSIRSQGFSFQSFEDYSQIFLSRPAISTVCIHISHRVAFFVTIDGQLQPNIILPGPASPSGFSIVVKKRHPLSLRIKFSVTTGSTFPLAPTPLGLLTTISSSL